MEIIRLIAVASCIALTGTAFAAEKAATGAELLEKRCSGCHSVANSKETKKSADQWDVTVSRMINKGANLSAEEKKTLVAYLAKTYKP